MCNYCDELNLPHCATVLDTLRISASNRIDTMHYLARLLHALFLAVSFPSYNHAITSLRYLCATTRTTYTARYAILGAAATVLLRRRLLFLRSVEDWTQIAHNRWYTLSDDGRLMLNTVFDEMVSGLKELMSQEIVAEGYATYENWQMRVQWIAQAKSDAELGIDRLIERLKAEDEQERAVRRAERERREAAERRENRDVVAAWEAEGVTDDYDIYGVTPEKSKK